MWARWPVAPSDRGKFAEEILRWQSARTLFEEVLMRSLSLLSCLVALCGLVLGASSSEARSFRVGQIPNGSQANCIACHVSGGGGPRNEFGIQVETSFLTVSGPISPTMEDHFGIEVTYLASFASHNAHGDLNTYTAPDLHQ